MSAEIVAGSSKSLIKYYGTIAKEVPSGAVLTFFCIP
jgi:hypothetical protein